MRITLDYLGRSNIIKMTLRKIECLESERHNRSRGQIQKDLKMLCFKDEEGAISQGKLGASRS